MAAEVVSIHAEDTMKLAQIVAKLRELNSLYCWNPALRDKPGTNWEQVNLHLWRIKAMYQGGDCELAGWPNALPHQRLHQYRPAPVT